MLRFSIIALSFFIVACSGNHYNPTTYNYEFNSELAKKSLKTVMIIPVNYEKPSRHYLQKYESSVDEVLKEYLGKSGYTTLSNRSFSSIWKNAQLTYGNTFNPATGQITSGFKPAMEAVLKQLFLQSPQLDAVIFTDLLESSLQYSAFNKRIAQWDGVSRKVKVEGVGESITDDFSWSAIVDGISIGVYVLNREQQLIHHSVGGIQIAQALQLNNKHAEFARRNDLLVKNSEIREGIELAMHPLIPMQDYPEKHPE